MVKVTLLRIQGVYRSETQAVVIVALAIRVVLSTAGMSHGGGLPAQVLEIHQFRREERERDEGLVSKMLSKHLLTGAVQV